MISTETPYSLSIRVGLSLEAAEAAVRRALKDEGFGILTEIDIAAAFREKLGRDFRPYRILGACNPPLAYEALSAQLELGTLLPCNVVLYEDGGRTTISAMDPRAVLGLVRHEGVARLAEEVRGRLERALSSLEDRAADAGPAAAALPGASETGPGHPHVGA